MWSLLKSSGWWLNSDSFVFPISGNYTCWKELIHFGKTVFSNLWSTETFFPFFVCKQIVGLLQGRRPRQHLGRPFRMAFFSQVKLGQGENSEQFEAGEKKKNPEMQHKAVGRRRHPPLCLPWWRPMVCHMNLRPSCSLQLPSESLWVTREGALTVREYKTNRLTVWLLGEAIVPGQFWN